MLDPEATPRVATSGGATPTSAQSSAPGRQERELQDQPTPSTWQGPERRLDKDRPRLSRVTHNLLQSYVGIEYEYDIQGNTVLKRVRYNSSTDEAGELKLAYDDENRLIAARKDRLQSRMLAEYRYDAFNRRIAKRVTEQTWGTGNSMYGAPIASSSKTTWFVWDGDVLAQEIDETKTITYLYEPESFVPVARIESAENDAFYAPDKVHIPPYRFGDQVQDLANPAQHVLAWRVNVARDHEQRHQAHSSQREEDAGNAAVRDKIHYYQCDQLGTPLELLDREGNAVWAVRYKAWGRVWQYDACDVAQALRFQGQYCDAETGLHYNRHRYYDPDAARFVTQDPIGLKGGFNLYQYGLNPISWIDPSGLSALTPLQLAKNITKLRNGQDVTVCNFKDADAVLYGAFPDAVKSTGAGNKPAQKTERDKQIFKELRQLDNGKATFHKDYKFITGTNVLYGHEDLKDGHEHKHTPHINIFTPEGRKATIYIEKACKRKGAK